MSRNCRKCNGVLATIHQDQEIHPFCKKAEDLENNPGQKPMETEFDRALKRWAVVDNPEEA